MPKDTDKKTNQSKTISLLKKLDSSLGISEKFEADRGHFIDWKNIKYRGSGYNYTAVFIFCLITMGAFYLIMLLTGLKHSDKNLFEIIVRYGLIGIMLIYMLIAGAIRILVIIGDTKNFIITNGMSPSKEKQINIRIKDIVEWKGTKLPWNIILKKDTGGKTGFAESSRYNNAVEIRLRDGRTIAFRLQKPLEFFDYLQEMESQDH